MPDVLEDDAPAPCRGPFVKGTVYVLGIAFAVLCVAFAVFGVPVTPTKTVTVRMEGTVPPNPGPNPPAPGPFDLLAGQIAAEARNVRGPNAAREARALADSIDRFVADGADRYPTLDALFQALRHSTTAAIPPSSSEAWRPFNQRFDELFSALFDAGSLKSCFDAADALRKVVDGLRQAAG